MLAFFAIVFVYFETWWLSNQTLQHFFLWQSCGVFAAQLKLIRYYNDIYYTQDNSACLAQKHLGKQSLVGGSFGKINKSVFFGLFFFFWQNSKNARINLASTF